MQDFLLFIDTETSGLPKDWTQPYSNNANWPYAVQVSWIIYTLGGTEIKREDHYIRDRDFDIGTEAYKVHGITRKFLNDKGEWRKDVMMMLHDDIIKYQPMFVGHFMELDYNVAGVDFYRLGMENPMDGLPRYCTMLGTKQFSRNPQAEFLRLGQLYNMLFNKPLLNQHNALIDAEATAACFFELLRTGTVDDEGVERQGLEREKIKERYKKTGCALPVLILLILAILIARWL